MIAQIDEGDGTLHTAIGCLHDRTGGTGEGDDGAVVIGVQFAVEDGNAVYRTDGIDDGVDDSGVAPFGKIGDALDKTVAGAQVKITPRFRVA